MFIQCFKLVSLNRMSICVCVCVCLFINGDVIDFVMKICLYPRNNALKYVSLSSSVLLTTIFPLYIWLNIEMHTVLTVIYQKFNFNDAVIYITSIKKFRRFCHNFLKIYYINNI